MAASESVMRPWAASLRSETVANLAPLRLQPGLEVCRDGELVWLRGPHLSAELELELRKVPGLRRFTVEAGGLLREVGHRVPRDLLPKAEWNSLAKALTIQLPTVERRETTSGRTPIRLVASAQERPAAFLLTNWSDWKAYAATASLLRLKPLRYAASTSGLILVAGHPLPPLPGQHFAESDGIAVPVGYRWSPAVDPGVVRGSLGCGVGTIAVLHGDGTYWKIPAEQWVAATRSGVRLMRLPEVA